MFDRLLLLVLCRIVALMIPDCQKCEWKIIKTEEIEKKKENELDVSISNHETGFLNFLRFIAFTIFPQHNKINRLVTFMEINLWSETDN